jgi:hypothetical protein
VGDEKEEGYIVEYIALGNSIKATAIDPETMREASVMGPKKATRKQLSELAVRKLRYLLRRDKDA